MGTKSGVVIKWRIENFSQWCADVHYYIRSPKIDSNYFDFMLLHPKGVSGQEENLVVSFHAVKSSFSGDISFHFSDGSLLHSHQVYDVEKGWAIFDIFKERQFELPPGPKFQDVLYRIRERDDVLTVRCRIKDTSYREHYVFTTINCMKCSVKLNHRLFEEMKTDEKRGLVFFAVSKDYSMVGLKLYAISDRNNQLFFSIETVDAIECPIAVEMCMRNEDTFGRCAKKEQFIFTRKGSAWIFPHSQDLKELVRKGISVYLDLNIKTSYMTPNPYYVNFHPDIVSFGIF